MSDPTNGMPVTANKEVTQVGRIRVMRRDSGIYKSRRVSIDAPDSEMFKGGLFSSLSADERKLLEENCNTDPVYPPWTLDRIQALADSVRDDPAAMPDEKQDAADAAMWIPTLRDLLEHRDRANRELDALAKSGVNVRTLRNLVARIESDMRIATEMGVCLSRLAVRWAEPFAKFGRESAMTWRGRVIRVTELERRILEATCVANDVSLCNLVKHAWKRAYHGERRSAYDQAFKRVNRKLASSGLPVQLHVRGTKLIVE